MKKQSMSGANPREDADAHGTSGGLESPSPGDAVSEMVKRSESERVLQEMVRENHRLLRALHDCEQRNEELRTRLSAHETPTPPPQPQGRVNGNKQAQPRSAPAPRRKGGDPRQSVRYRLGDVLVKAVSRPGRDTLAAPVQLWGLLREGLGNRRARRARRRAAG